MVFGIRPTSKMAVSVPASGWGFCVRSILSNIFCAQFEISMKQKYYEVRSWIRHLWNDEKKQTLNLHQKAPTNLKSHSGHYFALYLLHPRMQLALFRVTRSPLLTTATAIITQTMPPSMRKGMMMNWSFENLGSNALMTSQSTGWTHCRIFSVCNSWGCIVPVFEFTLIVRFRGRICCCSKLEIDQRRRAFWSW